MKTEEFKKEHIIETYKSLITISIERFKFLALINGGSVIALLSYLGSSTNNNLPKINMTCPVIFFNGIIYLWTFFVIFLSDST